MNTSAPVGLLSTFAKHTKRELFTDKQTRFRSLIRDLFLSEADILPDTDHKIMNVCIHHTAEARHNRAIEHLLEYLNDADYKYPRTKLIMRFSLGASELPAPGG